MLCKTYSYHGINFRVGYYFGVWKIGLTSIWYGWHYFSLSIMKNDIKNTLLYTKHKIEGLNWPHFLLLRNWIDVNFLWLREGINVISIRALLFESKLMNAFLDASHHPTAPWKMRPWVYTHKTFSFLLTKD